MATTEMILNNDSRSQENSIPAYASQSIAAGGSVEREPPQSSFEAMSAQQHERSPGNDYERGEHFE